MQKPTYVLDKRLKEPNSRSGRRGEKYSPLLQGIEPRSPAPESSHYLPELSRLQVTPSQGIPSMKNAVCPISFLQLTPAFSQKIYITIWYWHGMLKFGTAGLLEGAL
jgi:hypothetical protein